MTSSADRWGPFIAGLDPVERLARCRTLRAIVHLRLGPRGRPLEAELRRAERNDTSLEYALAGLAGLAPRDFRSVIATYAALSKPA